MIARSRAAARAPAAPRTGAKRRTRAQSAGAVAAADGPAPSTGAVSRIAPVTSSGPSAERQERDVDADPAAAPVARVELHLGAVVRAGQHPAQRRARAVDRQADVEAEEVLAVRLVGAQAPQLGALGVPDLDALLAVDDDDRHARGSSGSSRGTR